MLHHFRTYHFRAYHFAAELFGAASEGPAAPQELGYVSGPKYKRKPVDDIEEEMLFIFVATRN